MNVPPPKEQGYRDGTGHTLIGCPDCPVTRLGALIESNSHERGEGYERSLRRRNLDRQADPSFFDAQGSHFCSRQANDQP